MTQQLKLLLITTLFGSSLVVSPPAHSVENAREILTQRVEAFLWEKISSTYPEAEDIRVDIRSPDTRLNLEPCLEAELSLHGSHRIRSKVLVRATCSPSYAIHLSADVEVFEQVVVTNTALNRKHTISVNDLPLSSVNILSNQRQYLTKLEQAAGNTLTRSVRAGTALTHGLIKAPDLVSRGDSVVIVASRGDLVVRMPGIAMMTGGLDDQINVRNKSSDRVVKGWVKGPGEVHVPF